MSKTKFTTLIVYVIAIIVIVAGFFLLGFKKTSINYWAFGSLLFSTIMAMIVTLSLVSSNQNKQVIFYRAGLGSAIGIYLLVVFISAFSSSLFKDNINVFIFIQIAIHAIFLVANIFMITVSSHIYHSNEITAKKLQDGEYNTPKRGGF